MRGAVRSAIEALQALERQVVCRFDRRLCAIEVEQAKMAKEAERPHAPYASLADELLAGTPKGVARRHVLAAVARQALVEATRELLAPAAGAGPQQAALLGMMGLMGMAPPAASAASTAQLQELLDALTAGSLPGWVLPLMASTDAAGVQTREVTRRAMPLLLAPLKGIAADDPKPSLAAVGEVLAR